MSLICNIFPPGILGRVTNIATLMILGGLSLCVISITDSFAPLLTTSLSLLGKWCISASFGMIYIHSNEIFPTSIRNSGMGIVGCSARVGGIIAPHVIKLGEVYKNLHYIVIGIICFTSGVLVTKLPETKDLPLPESVEGLLSRRVHVVSVQSPSVSYKKISLVNDDQF